MCILEVCYDMHIKIENECKDVYRCIDVYRYNKEIVYLNTMKMCSVMSIQYEGNLILKGFY